MRVLVPFGRGNRSCEGIVLQVEDAPAGKLKAVLRALDEKPVLSERQLRLAAFIRERYFCTYYEAARAILPVGGRRDLVRRMLRRDGQVMDPCVAGFVRDRKHGQKRLGRVNVFAVRILLPDGQPLSAVFPEALSGRLP